MKVHFVYTKIYFILFFLVFGVVNIVIAEDKAGKVELPKDLALPSTELNSGMMSFGSGGRNDSAGLLLVGPTEASKAEAMSSAEKFGTEKTGYFDPMNGKDYVQAKTGPEFSPLPAAFSEGPTSGRLPPPTGGGGILVTGTMDTGTFNDGIGNQYGVDLSNKLPLAQWQPTVSPQVFDLRPAPQAEAVSQPPAPEGGEGKLCISNDCNPDLNTFFEKGAGGKYIIGGKSITGWRAHKTGESGPRFCLDGKGCVIKWEQLPPPPPPPSPPPLPPPDPGTIRTRNGGTIDIVHKVFR